MSLRISKGQRSNKGFTLVEVLVAMMIMAGSIIVLANMWSGNFLRIRKMNLSQNVTILLERKMVEIEALYKDKPLGEIPDEDKGDFGKEYPQYSWYLESKEFEMPDLSGALASEDGGADEMVILMVKQTAEFLSKAVKEVKVAVVVSIGKRKVEYPVTTYFVDYNAEMPLPNMGGAGGAEETSDDSSGDPDDGGGG